MSKKNSIQSEPPTKKAKVEANVKSDSDSKTFLLEIVSNRGKCSVDISNFKFNKNRCKMLSESQDVGDAGGGILYWMSRDQRVQDNWAILYAQRLALKLKLPLHVCFCLVPKVLEANIRQYGFMVKGNQENCHMENV